MYSTVANSMKRRPTPDTSCVWVEFKMAAWKPDVISNAKTVPSRVADTIERRSTPIISCVQAKSNMAAWATIMDSTWIQLLFAVSRRSIVSATLENMVIAFKIAFLSAMQVMSTSDF
jgi:hypothetical protein